MPDEAVADQAIMPSIEEQNAFRRGAADTSSAAALIARTSVLGVGISAVDMASAVDWVMAAIRNRERHYIAVTGVHGVVDAQDDPVYKSILNSAGLVVPDGMPMVWLSRRAGHRHVGRVYGPDFMLRVCQALSAVSGRCFYYGGNEGVAEELAETVQHQFPGLVTAGTYTPPFRELTEEERAGIAETINSAAPDVVWVGLSTPKQERWMDAFRDRLDAPVLVGVGAAFDYNTGKLVRAPAWMQKTSLEWLFRLIQEPRRLWRRYARIIPLFLYYLACERLGLRDFGGR